jgi:hypothetical protein
MAFLAPLPEAEDLEEVGSSSASNEFQAWQPGQRPSDTGDCQPHSRHA